MNHDTYLERRIPEFIDEINGTPFSKFGKSCNIRDYKNLSHFPVYFIYQFPISNEARQEMIRLSIDRRMPVYTTLSSETKDKRKIFTEMNKFIPVIKILNKKFEDYEFYILYSITPSLPANNKSIYIAVKSKSAVSFYNAKEEYNMYNDELDMILESAYEDGYYQALADMGYEFDEDEASEDVDIFDEDCFDEAVETGEAKRWNKAMKRAYVMQKAGIDSREVDLDKPLSGAAQAKLSQYRKTHRAADWDRNVGRRTPNAGRERRLDGYGKDYSPELAKRYQSSSGHGYKLGAQKKFDAYHNLRDARNKKLDDAARATSYRASALRQARRGNLTDDDMRRLGKMEAKQYHSSN
jgi:hypothetical protein